MDKHNHTASCLVRLQYVSGPQNIVPCKVSGVAFSELRDGAVRPPTSLLISPVHKPGARTGPDRARFVHATYALSTTKDAGQRASPCWYCAAIKLSHIRCRRFGAGAGGGTRRPESLKDPGIIYVWNQASSALAVLSQTPDALTLVPARRAFSYVSKRPPVVRLLHLPSLFRRIHDFFCATTPASFDVLPVYTHTIPE